jgi:hypothetical protein
MKKDDSIIIVPAKEFYEMHHPIDLGMCTKEDCINMMTGYANYLLKLARENNVCADCGNTGRSEPRTLSEQCGSNFIVKIDDKFCEWEFGFILPPKTSINDLTKAIEKKFKTEYNYKKMIK